MQSESVPSHPPLSGVVPGLSCLALGPGPDPHSVWSHDQESGQRSELDTEEVTQSNPGLCPVSADEVVIRPALGLGLVMVQAGLCLQCHHDPKKLQILTSIMSHFEFFDPLKRRDSWIMNLFV